MKLSSETLTVLKNFASINSGIEFKKGKNIATMSSTKTILAKATLPDDFPEDFCIYDLNKFLSVYSLYKDAEIDFENQNVIFKSNKKRTKYRTTSKSMIVTVPEKVLTLPSVDASFNLNELDFHDMMKDASVLQSPNISFESNGEKVTVTTFDAKDDAAHTTSIQVADGNGKTFKAVFLTENFKMVAGSYEVEISSQGLASFKNTKDNIQYWIALESKSSTFGE
jgi:hypothetical protein